MSNVLTSANDLLEMEFFNKDKWLIERILPYRGIMMLSAAPKSFKTWLVLYIASCVASGSPLFGKYPVKKEGVLFVDEENGLQLLQERIKMMKISDKNLFFMSFTGFRVDKESDIEMLQQILLDRGIGLVIFDTFIRVHNQDENDASKMRKIFHRLKPVLENASIIFTHHHRKEMPTKNGYNLNFQSLRGSSEISSFINCLFSVRTKDKDGTLLLRNELMRNDRTLDDIALKVTISEEFCEFEQLEGLGRYSVIASENKKRLLNLFSDQQRPLKLSEIEALTEIKKSSLRNILSDLEEDGLIKNESGPHNTSIYSLNEEDPVF